MSNHTNTCSCETCHDHSPISPTLEGRATATDAPATLLTQLMGVGYEFR